MARPEFQLIEEQDSDTLPTGAGPGSGRDAGLSLLSLALAQLSKRFVVALSSLFTLMTVGSAFWLWNTTPQPNVLQLIGLGMYAVFVIVINWIVRG
jgi:hypothetical protein